MAETFHGMKIVPMESMEPHEVMFVSSEAFEPWPGTGGGIVVEVFGEKVVLHPEKCVRIRNVATGGER